MNVYRVTWRAARLPSTLGVVSLIPRESAVSRSSLLVLVVFAIPALHAARAGAPPPISSFPAEVRPLASDSIPTNTRVWIFGKDPPPLSRLGASATVNGQPAGLSLRQEGCCLVVGELGSEVNVDDDVRVILTHAGGDVDLLFTTTAPADDTPPTLATPFVLDEAPGSLVLGVDGNDDLALAGFLARSGSDVLGAAPPEYVLEVELGERRCAEVVAVDLAGNESEPREVCTTLRPDDEEAPDGGPAAPADAGGADDPDDEASCTCASGGESAPSLLALLSLPILARLMGRRRTR